MYNGVPIHVYMYRVPIYSVKSKRTCCLLVSLLHDRSRLNTYLGTVSMAFITETITSVFNLYL